MEIWRDKKNKKGGEVHATGRKGGPRRRQAMKEAKGDGERRGREAREKG